MRARLAAAIVAAAVGVAWAIRLLGVAALDPTNLDWTAGDQRQHLLGWLMSRNVPLSFPLGRLPNLAAPVGTSVAFNDANPLVATFLHPLSPLLPADVQYIGPWLALCFALQGWLGARLVALYTRDAVQQALGGALFALAPVLAFRIQHENLCAHFFLLALLLLNVQTHARARRPLAIAAIVNAIAAAVHPFLVVMTLPLTGALIVRLWRIDRLVDGRRALVATTVVAVATTASFALFGYLQPAVELRAGGFGYFSADLLTLVNPMRRPSLLPVARVGPGQYEGFGYVGVGTLLLGLVAIGSVASRRSRRRWRRLRGARALPLAAAIAALFVFALASPITFAGCPLVHLDRIYNPLRVVVEPFRSSGRCVWPATYALTLAAIAGCAFALRRGVARAALAVALCVQVWDAPPPRNGAAAPVYAAPSLMRAIAASDRRLALIPPVLSDAGGWHCRTWPYRDPMLFLRWAMVAYHHHLELNSGYLSRFDERSGEAACDAALTDAPAEADTVYVVHPDWVDRIRRRGAICAPAGAMELCVSATRHDDLATEIRAAGLAHR